MHLVLHDNRAKNLLKNPSLQIDFLQYPRRENENILRSLQNLFEDICYNGGHKLDIIVTTVSVATSELMVRGSGDFEARFRAGDLPPRVAKCR